MKQILMVVGFLIVANFAHAGEELKVGVKGMVCAFCAQGIEKKFKAQSEVEKVDVSLENKFVKLTFKDGKRLANEKITEILKDAGYEAVFAPATVAAAKESAPGKTKEVETEKKK